MARTAKKKIAIKDEGVTLVEDADSINFVGDSVEGTAVDRDVTETHSALTGTTGLKLDQTTPQEIINGFPSYESTHAAFTEPHQIPDKEYVDQAVLQIGATFFLLDAADAGVATYRQTQMSASALATATVNSPTISSSTDTLIEEWISPSTMTFSYLSTGIYDLNIFAARTSGGRTCRLFWRFYERLADNSEVLIAQSNVSETFTAKARLRIYAALEDTYTPTAGSRLVGKVYVQTTGVPATDTVVTLYYQGDEDSHWEIPADKTYLDATYVRKAGDTMTGALVHADHEATGLIPQAINVCYGAIGDRPAAGTVPEGTVYFVLP